MFGSLSRNLCWEGRSPFFISSATQPARDTRGPDPACGPTGKLSGPHVCAAARTRQVCTPRPLRRCACTLSGASPHAGHQRPPDPPARAQSSSPETSCPARVRDNSRSRRHCPTRSTPLLLAPEWALSRAHAPPRNAHGTGGAGPPGAAERRHGDTELRKDHRAQGRTGAAPYALPWVAGLPASNHFRGLLGPLPPPWGQGRAARSLQVPLHTLQAGPLGWCIPVPSFCGSGNPPGRGRLAPMPTHGCLRAGPAPRKGAPCPPTRRPPTRRPAILLSSHPAAAPCSRGWLSLKPGSAHGMLATGQLGTWSSKDPPRECLPPRAPTFGPGSALVVAPPSTHS